MRETQEKESNTPEEREIKQVNSRKEWVTPELKVLPVPSKTEGGGPQIVTENAFYSS